MIPQDCQNQTTTTTMMSTTTTKNASNNVLLEDSGGGNNGAGGVIVSNKSPGYHDNNKLQDESPPPVKTTNHNQQRESSQQQQQQQQQNKADTTTPPSVSPTAPVGGAALLLDFSNNFANQTSSQQLNLQKLTVPSNQQQQPTNNTNSTNLSLGVIKSNLNTSSSQHQITSSSPSQQHHQITNRRNSNSSSDSDVSPFPGSIVYNPDGSAYIIEDSNMKHELGSTDLKEFPKLASAHYLSVDNPEMHSYRVYNARDGDSSQIIDMTTNINSAKPILMCFICKLSFGYGKSFLQHGVSEHKLEVNEVEVGLIGKNSSAILQVVGRGKEVLLSFLEPIVKNVQLNPPLIDLKPLLLSLGGQQTQQRAAAVEVGSGMDLRKSPTSDSSSSPPPNSTSTYQSQSPHQQQQQQQQNNYITGTTIGVCPEHTSGRPSGLDCGKCELILNSSRLGLNNLHTRNSCKTLKCPKCNWHYKYQETLEIHMKEKHPESEQSCVYCIAGQPHPRLARGETYTCGYKPYRCEVCNYSTTTKGNLSIHMQSDKHLNNMQELQSGVVMQSGDLLVSPGGGQPVSCTPQKLTPPSRAESRSEIPPPSRTPTPSPSQQLHQTSTAGHHGNTKPKPSFRCDVCNYETNVARNLRIHMTSEKHTHNMCVLQQNVKHMQHLQALQLLQTNSGAMSQQQQQHVAMETAAFLQQLQQHAMQMQSGQGLQINSPGNSSAPSPGSQQQPTESELADIAYNQALLIQMLTGQQQQPNQQQLQEDGLNPSQLDPPPDPPNPNPTHYYQCCICNYNNDNLELLNNHLNVDRTKSGEQEVLNYVQGNYNCKLCCYKTNLKANFQLHCKTDKHLQKLQFLNHLREGGRDLRGVLGLVTSQSTMQIQLRCNVCDYYTNSMHKLQVHTASRGHEIMFTLFGVLREKENEFGGSLFYCGLCGYSCRGKGGMLQHGRSPKHLQLEQLAGKDPTLIYRVLPQDGDRPPSCSSTSSNFSGGGGVSPGVNAGLMRSVGGGGGGGDKHHVLKSALTTITCPYCEFTTDQDTKLHQHLLTQHSGSSSASSSDFHAGKLLSSTPWKQVQQEESEEETLELCPLCQQSFGSKGLLESHVVNTHQVSREGLARLLALVTSATPQQQQPESCSRRKRSKSKPTRIIQQREDSETDSESEQTNKSYHDNNANANLDPRCSICNTAFLSYEFLFRHQSQFNHFIIKSVDGVLHYNCWACSLSFGGGLQLQQHYIQEHLPSRQQQQQQQQQKAVVADNILISEKHVYKYRCQQCSLAFKTIDKLQLHTQYHTMREATKCTNCGKCFRSAGGLERHQTADCKTTSISDQKQELESNSDSEESNGSGNYEDYLNTATLAEDNYSDPARKYKCHRCKLAFTRQSYLTSHNKTLLHRKGEKTNYPLEKYLDPNRPYKCEVCKESFTQKNILLVHYNSVSHLHKLKNNSSSSSGMGSSNSGISNSGSLVSTSPQQPTTIASPQQQQITTSTSSTSPQQQQLMVTMATGQSPPPTINSLNPITMTTSTDDSPDNNTIRKPYKCNICRVAYTQGSTLDIHMRSVLHQTRASKLQELISQGQVDGARPLIEQPTTTTTTTNSSNILKDLQVQQQTTQQMAEMAPPQSFSSDSSSGLQASDPVETKPNSITMETNQEDLLRNRPTTTLYKHILQSYGFELAMHHNEYNTNTRLLVDGDEGTDFKSNYPELVKSECSYCGHVFSSVWILKEHLEQVHSELIEFGIVEEYAVQFRKLYEEREMKVVVAMETDEQTTPPSRNDKQEQQLQQIRIDEQQQQQSDLEQMNESLLQQLNIGLLNPAVFLAAVAAQVQQQQQLNAGQQQLNPSSLMMMPPIYGGNSDLASVVAAAAAAQAASSTGGFNFPGMQQSPFNFGNYNNEQKLQELIKQQDLMQREQQREQQHIHSSVPGPIATTAPPQQQLQQQNNQPTKRARTRITDDQLKVLRAHFDINNSPSEEQIQTMALQSGLPPKVIKHWFRNTLFKERQRNKDSPYNFSNPPSTTLNLEEYEKTGEAKVGVLTDMERAEYSKQDDMQIKNKSKRELQVDVGQNNPSKSDQIENGRPVQVPPQQQQQHQQQNNNYDLPTNLSLTLQNLQQFNSNNLLAYYQQVNQQQTLAQVPPRCYDSADSDSGSEKPAPKKPKKSKKKSDPPEMLPPPASITPLPLNMSPSPSPSSSGLTTPPLGQGSSANSISGLSSGKRANRTRFTDYQIKVLQEFFENNAYPKDDDLEYLSKLLGLSPRVIVVWFQNARQKARKVYENQPPAAIEAPVSNPSTTPPSTNSTNASAQSEENRFQRTPGLNYQCKKCLLVFQRYYELIRHQKTHCFKEEDAKRSAQAQAAAANVASKLGTNTTHQSLGQGSLIGMSSNESNSSRSSNGQCSPTISSNTPGQLLGLDKYTCDKCGSVPFSSYEQWREHQLQHLMQYNASAEISIPSLLMQQSQPFNLTTSGYQQQHRSPNIGVPPAINMQPAPINVSVHSPAPPINISSGGLHYKQPDVNSESSNEASLKRKYSTEDLTEDEYDHSNQVQRDKRLRTTILPEQLDYLYQKYQIESNPSRKMLEQIAREVGLKKRVVQVWFQNTRARERKGQYRAHSQVINKKCPYCSAIFKVKSALESHLLSKHGEDGLDVDGIEELGEECSGGQGQNYGSIFGGGVLDLSAGGGNRAPQNSELSDEDDDEDGGRDDEDSL